MTCYTCITEKVLVFQIRTVTPTEYLESDKILLSRLQITGQVEFSFQFAILAITYEFPVHPYIHIRTDRTEMSDNVFSAPRSRHRYFLPVRTDMILFGRHIRRIVLILITPRETGIHIDRVTISVQFPYPGHLHIIPTFIIETDFPKIGRTLVGICHPKEFPCAVQAHKVLGLFFCSLCRFFILECKKSRMHRSTVDCIYFWILPFAKGLGMTGKKEPAQKTQPKCFSHASKFKLMKL